jgi:hypothetical protein
MVNVRSNPPPFLGRHGILMDSDGLSRSLDLYYYQGSMFCQTHTCYFCPSLGVGLNPIIHFRGPLNMFRGRAPQGEQMMFILERHSEDLEGLSLSVCHFDTIQLKVTVSPHLS